MKKECNNPDCKNQATSTSGCCSKCQKTLKETKDAISKSPFYQQSNSNRSSDMQKKKDGENLEEIGTGTKSHKSSNTDCEGSTDDDEVVVEKVIYIM
jgi:hypothetical protein